MKDRWLLFFAALRQVFKLPCSRYTARIVPAVKTGFDGHGSSARVFMSGASRKVAPVVFGTLVAFALRAPVQAQDTDAQLKALSDQWAKLSEANDHKGAIAVAQERLALVEKTYGPDSLQTAEAQRIVGNSYYAVPDNANAISFYKRALAIYEKADGRPRKEVCSLRWGIAVNTADVDAMLAAYDAALGCYETVSGIGSESTQHLLEQGITLYSSNLRGRSDRIAPREQFVQHWLPLVMLQLGPNHAMVAQLLDLQADVLAERKDFEGAWVTRRRAIAIARNIRGEEIFVIGLLHGILNSAGQRPVDAEYMFYAALRAEMQAAAFGANGSDAVASREFLAKTRLANPDVSVPALPSAPHGKYDDTFLTQYEEVRSLSAKAHQSKDNKYQRLTAAISASQKLLGITEERLGPSSREVAQLLQDIGENYRLKGDTSAAESYLARSVVIYERQGSLSWEGACWTRAHLGQVYAGSESWDRAAAWYASAMDCFEKDKGPGFQLVGWAFDERMKALRKAHPEQVALFDREQQLRTLRVAEFKRALAEANTARKPIASPTLDALIKMIPVVKPEAPVQMPVAPVQAQKSRTRTK